VTDAAPVITNVDGRPLSRRGLDTRRRLLDAAEHVFGELGYHEASVVKLAEAAGVATGTFYLYFDSKRSIFEELVRDLNLRIRRAMTAGAAKGRTRREAELLGFDAYFKFTTEHPSMYRIIRQSEFAAPEMLRYHYEQIARGYASGLSRAADRGEVTTLDAEVTAYALMGLGELIGMKWILWGEGEPLPAHVWAELERIIGCILGGAEETE
jgi:AcrR family transcriptional regulator